MDSIDAPPSYPPPPPPKKRLSRPKITLQIPEATVPMTPRGPQTAASFYYGAQKYRGRAPTTPASHVSDYNFNPFMHAYHNKASEFMFKQFEGFKDFTMNTAKSGLSAGEKSAFWFVNKLKILSKKWFTHFFLTICLVLYSLIGAAVFMALEGVNENMENNTLNITRNLTDIRRDAAIRLQEAITASKISFNDNSADLLSEIESSLEQYEANYTDYINNVKNKKTWTFWNSMFYAGTIYTTIGKNISALSPVQSRSLLSPAICESSRKFWSAVGMSEEGNETENILTLQIPIIRAESETQTTGHLVSKTPGTSKFNVMETEQRQAMSIRKRRNLSKNRGQAARQREKTPEPSRTLLPHDDTGSEDEEREEVKPQRNSREREAESNYLEMKRLVLEKSGVKDPVYDIDTNEILVARATAAHERRRRSISPFAIPDKEELSALEGKGSFMDPVNKLLSTNYTLSPKDEDSKRRSSLTIEPPVRRHSLTVITPPGSSSPVDKNLPFAIPTTPKKLEEMVYDDEKKPGDKKLKTPVEKENVFTFDEKDTKQALKDTSKPAPKTPETPVPSGELVTKVIQIERTPSRKLAPDMKPNVEVRERIVRTPSRKLSADIKPVIIKQQPLKQVKDETQNKLPPVKPARSKSATRFGSKTSESEMSEDQGNQRNTNVTSTKQRKVVPTPRRFIKNKSPPRPTRSQSVNRFDETKVIDTTGTGMSQTSREIIELMQKARARSLSIPKDDPRLPSAYKSHAKNLKTPNKTPSTPRNSRGISCPKTIQIISDKEILSSLTTNQRIELEHEKRSRQSSGYVDASQSEYTSSCYSTSPSENEYEFDLSERTAELTRKLKQLSKDVDIDIQTKTNIIMAKENMESLKDIQDNQKPVLRKRSLVNAKNEAQKRKESVSEKVKKSDLEDKKEKPAKSRWKIISNWQQFKQEHKSDYDKIIFLRNRCICSIMLLIISCGLGGMMFKSLEGSFENAYKCGTRSVKRDFIEALWRGSHYLREEEWKSLARNKLFEFENQLHTAYEAGVTSYSGLHSWNFMNSFVYCFTLITTIGYGHIAPKTTYGQLATIIYAIIGIPLFLIVLADFGKLFTRIIKFFWSFIRRFYYTRSCRKVRRTVPMQEVMKGLNIVYDAVRRPSQIFNEDEIEESENGEPPQVVRKPSDVPPPLPPKPGSALIRDPENDTDPETPAPSVFEIDDEFNLPISVAIFILVVYILIGAVIYYAWEKWSFFESFYFVFISMSTIGLGDLVPDHPHRMMGSILYLVFGLALTSMCINVVQVKLNDTFKKASAKLGATIGLKVAEEDGSLVPITPPPTEIVPVHKPKTETPDVKAKEIDENESNNKNR